MLSRKPFAYMFIVVVVFNLSIRGSTLNGAFRNFDTQHLIDLLARADAIRKNRWERAAAHGLRTDSTEGSGKGIGEGSWDGSWDDSWDGSWDGSVEGSGEGSGEVGEENGGEGSHECVGDCIDKCIGGSCAPEQMVIVLQGSRRKITITKKLFELQQWYFNRAEHNETCVPFASCFSDDDCGGHTCIGAALRKCNCGACQSFLSCKDDSECGGLVGACNNRTNICDCDKGFKMNGMKGLFDAFSSVCNLKNCIPNTNSCFGLPCNEGVCSCV